MFCLWLPYNHDCSFHYVFVYNQMSERYLSNHIYWGMYVPRCLVFVDIEKLPAKSRGCLPYTCLSDITLYLPYHIAWWEFGALCRTTLVLSNEVVLSRQGIPFKNTRLFIHRAPHHFWYELFYDSMELEFSIIKCYEYVFFNAWEYPSRFNHIQYQNAHADSRSSSLVQLKSKTST